MMSCKEVLISLKVKQKIYAEFRKKHTKTKETFINDRILYEYYSGMLYANKEAIKEILFYGVE